MVDHCRTSQHSTQSHTPSKTRSVLEHTTFLSEEELMSHFICSAGIWKTFFSTFCQCEEPPGGAPEAHPGGDLGALVQSLCQSSLSGFIFTRFCLFLIDPLPPPPTHPPPFLLAFITIRSDIKKKFFSTDKSLNSKCLIFQSFNPADL